MPASEIHGSEHSLDKVFSNEYLFSIPMYQRPYAWTTEQASELFEDVKAAMGSPGGSLDDAAPYFLGSIVLIKPDALKPASDVVDGQQRLTTISILLAALRETSEDPKVRTALTGRLYEEADALSGTNARYRLTLRERDAEFFRKHIQDEGGFATLEGLDRAQLENDAQRNLRENALFLRDELKKLTPGERNYFARFLSRRCFVIIVSTRDQKSAYRIFSVLNDRGMDLSYTDILKAEMIGNVPPSAQETYAKKWEGIEDSLGRAGFEELWAHIRTVYRKEKARDTTLEEIREYINPAGAPLSDPLICTCRSIPLRHAMSDPLCILPTS
jgi:uncharacterized protein with ParB-like and HNH nuclease domain